MSEASTSDKILDAAELLFADKGFAGTSLRSVIAKAEVNLAAVHYHFGSKDGLIKAVFRRCIAKLNAERLQLLDRALERAKGNPLSIEEILHAFLAPALQHSQISPKHNLRFIKFMARIHGEIEEPLRSELFVEFKEVLTRFLQEITRSLPTLDIDQIATRLFFTVGVMGFTMLRYDPGFARALGMKSDLGPDDLVDRIVQFCAAGFSAENEAAEG
jgi:AcrR family transcriptional regulator